MKENVEIKEKDKDEKLMKETHTRIKKKEVDGEKWKKKMEMNTEETCKGRGKMNETRYNRKTKEGNNWK